VPHLNLRGGKPIHERSGGELIRLFVVFPVAMGAGLLTLLLFNLAEHRHDYTWQEWLGFVWGLMLSAGLMVGMPAAAWQEWQRRKQFRHTPPAKSHHERVTP
jgi:hypothetical protein